MRSIKFITPPTAVSTLECTVRSSALAVAMYNPCTRADEISFVVHTRHCQSTEASSVPTERVASFTGIAVTGMCAARSRVGAN